MDSESSIRLETDKEFARLIQPFSKKECQRICEKILSAKSLVFHTWNGILVDENGLYELSLNMGVPYNVCPLLNKTRENIIKYICGKQLQRTDLTTIMKKYLIGKKSLAECAENSLTENRFGREITKTEIRKRIGAKYAYSHDSVREFELGAGVIDILFDIDSNIAEKILTDNTSLFFYNLVCMSRLSQHRIKEIALSLSKNNFEIKKLINLTDSKSLSNLKKRVSVKNLPKYDPDSEILSLTLTIPSWINSVERVQKTLTCQVSNTAAENLFDKICELRRTIDQTADMVMEVLS